MNKCKEFFPCLACLPVGEESVMLTDRGTVLFPHQGGDGRAGARDRPLGHHLREPADDL